MTSLYLVLLLTVLESFHCLNIARYSSSPVQYHIQTDDGTDRYFRYQTYNGQWRKEKRLESGKVIGAYGWTDDLGVLRLYDYLADENGYRIIRERNIRVNKNNKDNELLEQLKNRVRPFRPATRKNTFEKARKQLKKKPTVVKGETGLKTEQLITNDIIDTNRGKAFGSPKRSGRQLNRGKKLRVIDKRLHTSENEKELKVDTVRPRVSMSRQLRDKLKKHKKMNKYYMGKDKEGSSRGSHVEDSSRGSPEEDSIRGSSVEGSSKGSTKVPPVTNALTQSTNGETNKKTNFVRKKRRLRDYTLPRAEESRTTIDFDSGNIFRYEVERRGGGREGRHGYVDPMGFLRVTNYVTTSTGGYTEQRTSAYVGSRRVGATDYRCTPTCL